MLLPFRSAYALLASLLSAKGAFQLKTRGAVPSCAADGAGELAASHAFAYGSDMLWAPNDGAVSLGFTLNPRQQRSSVKNVSWGGVAKRRVLAILVCSAFLVSSLYATAGSISLSNLSQNYNGTPRSATVTTVPAGLAYTITYGGVASPPTNAGSYNVTATLMGEPVSATGTLVINKANLFISFPELAEKKVGDGPFALSAAVLPTWSGLSATYTSSNPAVATISGNLVTIVGAGTTTITASQPGNHNFNPAASVARTLTVVGLPQTLLFDTLPTGKRYGDPPFTLNATVNTGLPITFRSSDPSVATVSGNLVTIVGAGQCSVLALQAGNAVYAYTAVAQPLVVAPADLPMPPSSLAHIHDGNPKGIDPTNLPVGVASQIRYRSQNQTAATITPQLAFQNGPDTLSLSYNSIGLQANGLWGMGKCVRLAGTARKLHSCDVTLVTWARYNNDATYGYLNWANANPSLVVPPTPGVSIPGNSGGWYHPVTITFYDYNGEAQTWTCLARKTVEAFIPWRPMFDANGGAYTLNGYAFRVPFSFPDGVVLPDDVWVTVGFNTNTAGEQPVGAPGPYDALNLSQAGSILTGTDILSAYQLLYRNWTWTSGLSPLPAAPMLRLWTIPTNETLTPPSAVGNYEVKTVFTGKGLSGQATTAMTIGYDFTSWKEREIAAGRLPTGQAGDLDDPDKDGITNLQEFAFALNPGAPDAMPGYPPRLSTTPTQLAFTYRRNLLALDVDYTIEGVSALSQSAPWNRVIPIEETILSDDGGAQVIEAALPKPSNIDAYFLRLKVSR